MVCNGRIGNDFGEGNWVHGTASGMVRIALAATPQVSDNRPIAWCGFGDGVGKRVWMWGKSRNRHPGVSRGPVFALFRGVLKAWIPAFAGMTNKVAEATI